MSNRQKPKNGSRRRKIFPRKVMRDSLLKKINMPTGDKLVVKTVPAMAFGEQIGESIIYEDGSIDVITYEDISDQAKKAVVEFKAFMVGEDEEVDYAPDNDGEAGS